MLIYKILDVSDHQHVIIDVTILVYFPRTKVYIIICTLIYIINLFVIRAYKLHRQQSNKKRDHVDITKDVNSTTVELAEYKTIPHFVQIITNKILCILVDPKINETEY